MIYDSYPHPDTLTDWQAFKELKRGGRQAAEDVAMEAMWLALEQGRSREEAERIFSQTYINVLPWKINIALL